MKTSRSIRGGSPGVSREVDFGMHQIRIVLFGYFRLVVREKIERWLRSDKNI